MARLEKGSPEYVRVLEVIREGQKQLRARPRADMPGFVPWKTDLQRQAHLEKYRGIEMRVREAIRTGRKLNDSAGGGNQTLNPKLEILNKFK